MSSCLFGQTGPLRALRRLRHDGRLAGRVLPPHRLARPPAVRAVRRLQRLHVAALRAVRRCSPPLDHRRRTGEGQYLDFAQAEACAPLPHARRCSTTSVNGHARRPATATPTRTMAPARRVPVRRRRPVGGHRLPRRRRLARRSPTLIGRPDLAALDGRAARPARDELDALVAGWTARARRTTAMHAR